MKKILFVNNNLRLGGIQKSLVNLLNEINDKYEIDLVLFNKDDELLSSVPDNVNIIELGFPIRQLAISHSESKKYGIGKYIESTILRILARFGKKAKAMKYILKHTPQLEGKYDVAISYMHNPKDTALYGGCNEYVLEKVNAKKKITYIHADYSKFGGNTPYNESLIKQFDRVVAVTEDCKNILIELLPDVNEKVKVVNNCINYKNVLKGYNEKKEKEYDKSVGNIVTIARLSEEKGVLRVVPALKALKDSRIPAHWYIVGDGPLRAQLEEMIKDNDVSDMVTLLGGQVNPYKYLNGADLFLLPSYQEAESVVIKEALVVHVPVLSTATASAKNMIASEYGFICENDDNSLVKALLNIMRNKTYIDKKDNLAEYIATDDKIVKQFENLIEN